MPQIAFVDEELTEELQKINGNESEREIFPEHQFLGSCLRAGFTISDLEKLTYVDVMKVIVTFISSSKTRAKTATQNDIDKLLG